MARTEIGGGATIGPLSTLIDTRVGARARVVHSYLDGADVGDRVSVGPFATSGRAPCCAKAPRPARSSRSRTRTSAPAPRCRTCPTSATPTSAREPTSAPGRSPPTTTARTSTARRSVPASFVSVDTMLVAPVSVGDGAYTGAGSVITDDVPAGLARDRPRAPDEHRGLSRTSQAAGFESRPATPKAVRIPPEPQGSGENVAVHREKRYDNRSRPSSSRQDHPSPAGPTLDSHDEPARDAAPHPANWRSRHASG